MPFRVKAPTMSTESPVLPSILIVLVVEERSSTSDLLSVSLFLPPPVRSICSTFPTASEHREAHRWAVRYVKRRGLLGKLVGAALSGDVGAEPATAALVTASIPVILELARRALRVAEREGAPADPRTSTTDAAQQEYEEAREQ